MCSSTGADVRSGSVRSGAISRCRPYIVLAALVLPVLSCGRGGASSTPPVEAPPPPIETALGPGSRLIEPRVQELMHRMSDRLAQVSALAIEAEEVYDEVPADRPRTQLTSVRRVAMRRPDRLVTDTVGDAYNRSLWYDGRTASSLDREQNVWTSGTVPARRDCDWVRWSRSSGPTSTSPSGRCVCSGQPGKGKSRHREAAGFGTCR